MHGAHVEILQVNAEILATLYQSCGKKRGDSYHSYDKRELKAEAQRFRFHPINSIDQSGDNPGNNGKWES